VIQEIIVPGGVTVQQQNFRHDAYAAYTEATVKPVESLAIVLGLRYGHERLQDTSIVPAAAPRAKTYNSLTPRVSVRYTFMPELNAYFTYSRGFKSGLTGITNTAINFAPVEPEKITSYEVGLKYATSRLTLNGSAFYYDYKNKQEQTFTGTSTVIQNTGPVRIYGVDLDGNARLSQDFTLRAALTWIPQAKYRDFPGAVGQSTQTIPFPPGGPFACIGGACGAFLPLSFDATGARLIRTPELTASSTLSYEHRLNGGTIDASGTVFYSTRVKEELTNTLTQGAYATVNAQVGYRFGDGVRIGLYGRNLTNKAYMVAGLSSSAAFVPTYAPPREIGATLNYAF